MKTKVYYQDGRVMELMEGFNQPIVSDLPTPEEIVAIQYPNGEVLYIHPIDRPDPHQLLLPHPDLGPRQPRFLG